MSSLKELLENADVNRVANRSVIKVKYMTAKEIKLNAVIAGILEKINRKHKYAK
jgi:hypothetical protein